MKIWITGGSGSLGRALISALTSQFPVAEILSPSRNELDLSRPESVLSFVESAKPTHVYHLAAKVFGIGGHTANPSSSLLENTLIDYAVFDALLSFPPDWVYYSSTVAAYGYPYSRIPLREEDWLLGAPHLSEYGYAMAKRHALSYLRILERTYNTKFVYGLTTNLFGTADRFLEGKGHVVISLLERARLSTERGTGLDVWGTGSATRDFLSVTDAAEILVELIGVNAGVLNIASGVEISIRTLAELIVDSFNIHQGLTFTGDREGITSRVCDISKLRQYSSSVQKVDSLSALKRNIDLVAQGRSQTSF